MVTQKWWDNTVGSVNLTNEQKSLIVGTLLGDGCLEKRKKNPRLRIDHAEQQKEYVFWKYGILQDAATREPHILHEKDRRSGKTFTRWYFSTKTMPELDFYHQLFYRGKKKIISEELAEHLTNPLSLAVWLMDDGYKRNDCDALRLSTDCFSFEEQVILQNCLDKNFGISSKIHRKGKAWNLYIPQTEMERVRILLHRHIIPSMSYKLPPRNDFARVQRAG